MRPPRGRPRRRARRAAAAAASRSGSADVQAADASRGCAPGIGELDRVLGGGLVPGSLVLLGGSPGIGKSTLTVDGARQPRRAPGGARCTSPARSPRRRSGCGPSACRARALEVPVLAETDLDTVLATLDAERPEVCVIDSVQTLHAPELTRRGGLASARCARSPTAITRLAKARGIAVLLVGHVTKEGALAGPRVLEHLVDCVLQFEGERERTYRTLRALKNRFGSTNEVGVFEMRHGGLVEVAGRVGALRRRGDARARERRAGGHGGLAPAAGRGPGARLAVRARAAAPRRQRDRPQPARARARRARPPRRHRARARADVFVNVAGGVRVDEPGADLAVALAVASAARGRRCSAGRRAPSPLALLRRGRADRRAALRRHTPTAGWPRRAKFGLRPVIAPTAPAAAPREASDAARRRCARRCRVLRAARAA